MVKIYVGSAANPTNGVRPDFSCFKECGYFEGPATNGGPHFFNCPVATSGRHVAVTIIDEITSVLNICEVIVNGYTVLLHTGTTMAVVSLTMSAT